MSCFVLLLIKLFLMMLWFCGRREILSMVKKHSNILRKTVIDEQDASDIQVNQGYWHDALNLYFILSKESRGSQDDDLIFFVRQMELHGNNSDDDSNANPPYFVRRLASKEAHTVPAYPDICFAIDDFDSTFETVVLSDVDHCYCVVLNAHAGAAFPDDESSNNNAPENDNLSKTNQTKVTIFSGFVSYQTVREAFDAGRHRLGNLLSLGHSSGKADKLYMRGPGGRGEVEVAVSGVEVDQSQHISGLSSPNASKSGVGFATIVKQAVSVASFAAKAYASATRNADDEMLPLKCCLMSISLPWENIAYDLLFKVRAIL
ncbi:hypothetical protein KSS87_018025 [Heliosperma pusillum]|nr:hypothetical protein KSS87_018025 [Heliosperma pusillum]